MDEGLPIGYEVLHEGVPVRASDGQQVGTVAAVLAAPEEDVFHGLLVDTPQHGIRFVEAASIAAMYEAEVELRIDSTAAHSLPAPEHKAPVYDEDPMRQQRWRHWVHMITGRSDWNRRR